MNPNTIKNIPHDLLFVNELIYNKNEYTLSSFFIESESLDYSAVTFNLNNYSVKFRVAKTTPTKIGQFVTFWKRNKISGIIAPFDESDKIDFFIVNTRSGSHFGQFIFPKAALLKHGVLSKNNKGGKRAIRVYPSWDITTSKQAMATQRWQLEFFLEITDGNIVDHKRFKNLMQNIS